jgi:hypothetical protein
MKQRKIEDPVKRKEDTVESNQPMQGEGNYTAGRRYDEAQRKFVKSGQVDEAARSAEPRSEQERDEMERSEQQGLGHARK